MKIQVISDARKKTGFIKLIAGRFKIEAKVYDEPSQYGINNGRISKLWIQNKNSGKTIANYDRGWDFNHDELVVKEVVRYLERLPKVQTPA